MTDDGLSADSTTTELLIMFSKGSHKTAKFNYCHTSKNMLWERNLQYRYNLSVNVEVSNNIGMTGNIIENVQKLSGTFLWGLLRNIH